MSDRARYIGGPFEDEGKAWRTFASMMGHWHMRGYGLFSVITRADDQLVGFIGNWWPLDFPGREIGWTLLAFGEGKGILFEAAREVQRHSFHTPGWSTAVSYIHPETPDQSALPNVLAHYMTPMRQVRRAVIWSIDTCRWAWHLKSVLRRIWEGLNDSRHAISA
jgi:hypothetical protein